MGVHPNREDNELISPSHINPPESSLVVTSRFNAVSDNAEISPIVSVAETRKIITIGKIAFRRNSNENGKIFGTAIMEISDNPEKSTFPKITARIYPTIIPTKTERFL